MQAPPRYAPIIAATSIAAFPFQPVPLKHHNADPSPPRSSRAGGLGLNLQAARDSLRVESIWAPCGVVWRCAVCLTHAIQADTVVLFDLDWNPQNDKQERDIRCTTMHTLIPVIVSIPERLGVYWSKIQVFLEFFENQSLAEAVARVHRVGQTREVRVASSPAVAEI